MAWPTMSDVTEAAKSLFTSPEPTEPAGDEPKVEAVPEEKKTDAAAPSPGQDEQKQTPPDATPSTDPAAIVAGLIKEKGAKALLEMLPEDAREAFNSEAYRKLHQTLSSRDREHAQALAQRDAQHAHELSALDKKIEEIADTLLTAGMSDEEKSAHKDARELARLRAERAAPQPQPQPVSAEDVTAAIARTPFAPAFWQTVEEIGLPRDPANPQVRAFYEASLKATLGAPDVQTAIEVMRQISPSHKPKTAPRPVADDDIEKRVAERVEKLLDERLRKAGLLATDTGRAGAAGGATTPKNYKEARAAAEELLRRG